MKKNELEQTIRRKKFVLMALFILLVFTAAPAAAGGMFRISAALPGVLPGQLFTDETSCQRCHDHLTDRLGQDVSFVTLWRTTIMRLSFIDPLWKAKVRSETLRMPAASPLTAVDIEKKCVRCHAPMASEQAIQDGSDIRLFEDGFASAENPYHGLAMEGVSCTLCHQITSGPKVGDPFSGRFEISDWRVGYGPFNPDFAAAMENNSGYRPEHANHLGQSEFCAKCHDLHTDYVDENGVIVSTPETLFPEQTPYLEWLESDYSNGNTHCQYCHMDPAGRTKIASKPRKTRERPGVLRHTFYTENTMMLSIIDSLSADLGWDLPDLTDAIDDGQEYLAGAGSIEIEDMSLNQNTLTVVVKVSNLTGHKLPTSIPIRRAFIHFAVYATDGDLIFSSGDVDEEGRIMGVNADFPPYTYEPHYDLITSPEQVQVYEGIMGTVEEDVTYTLLRASHFIKDNRILPIGFDKNNPEVDPRILPAGSALANDANFNNGEDRITYEIPILSRSEFHIVAELKDQTLAYPFIADLSDDAASDENGPIPIFLDEYDHHKVHFEIIAKDTADFITQ